MLKNKDNYLKLAIQKAGRLTEPSLELLKLSGLEFKRKQKKLLTFCDNYPLEILFVDHKDIPKYLELGVIDFGIIGQDLIYETKPKIKELIKLNFGFCSLCVVVPKKSHNTNISALRKLKIATSYPNSTEGYFRNKKIPIKIIKINGSVEITPRLGIADGVVDLVSTGITLMKHDLIILDKIFDSKAVLASSTNNLIRIKKTFADKLISLIQHALI